jgi:ABC-type uncharacterized transport system ATPase subunit
VLRVSQRIAVLRGGRLVGVLPAAGADKAMLAEAMVGRRVAPAVKHAARTRCRGVPRCAGRDAAGPGPRPLLADVNLALRAGEVLAVAGVAGNGQQALAELLCGEVAPTPARSASTAARCRRARATGCTPAWRASRRTATPWAWSANCRCGRTPASSAMPSPAFARAG